MAWLGQCSRKHTWQHVRHRWQTLVLVLAASSAGMRGSKDRSGNERRHSLLPPPRLAQAWGLEWTMDVGYYGGRGVYEPLMETFEQAYNGNRVSS